MSLTYLGGVELVTWGDPQIPESLGRLNVLFISQGGLSLTESS